MDTLTAYDRFGDNNPNKRVKKTMSRSDMPKNH